MALKEVTLDTDTPETEDGRRYPEHLRSYHRYDEELLPIAARLGEFTFDQLAAQIEEPRLRAIAPRWLASAGWRGLVKRRKPAFGSPLVNAITERGLAELRALSA